MMDDLGVAAERGGRVYPVYCYIAGSIDRGVRPTCMVMTQGNHFIS